MKKSLGLALIGCGLRGVRLLSLLMSMSDIEITALCDTNIKKLNNAKSLYEAKLGKACFCTSDFEQIISETKTDAAIICTPWRSHISISVAFMQAGIPVGIEAGGANSLDECYTLAITHKKTGIHAMLLENCCYARDELMILNMAKHGVFGDIIHCMGGYRHDLRCEIANGARENHYRLYEYMEKNCENYPTHALGPISQLLNIGRGNHFESITSVSSKSAGMREYFKTNNPYRLVPEMKQGDIVTSIIKCANGETVTLTLDTTLPRYYSRDFAVYGTKGMYASDTQTIYIDSGAKISVPVLEDIRNNIDHYRAKWEHPLWKQNNSSDNKKDIMDNLVLRAFIDSVKNDTKPPINTYDTATLLSVSPLSEASIKRGGIPIEIPDFYNINSKGIAKHNKSVILK